MKRTTIDTAWIRRTAWTTSVLLLGLLLSSCGFAVGGINSGVGESEQEVVPGNNEGGQPMPCGTETKFTAIGDKTGLEAIENDLSGSYCVTSDITLTGNWKPLGAFTGTLDGKGHTINGLMIDESTDTVGFFKELGADATVKDLIFDQPSVKGKEKVGVLAGTSNATIENIKIIGGTIEGASGTPSSSPNAGGLVGNNLGTIKYSYTTSDVIGHNAGGLVGRNLGAITNSYAAGGVSGDYVGGGLVASNLGTIENSYVASNVSGYYYAGGLVGLHQGTIENSYATGGVSGREVAGGLAGGNEGTIKNSYATNEVVGATVGGLVGFHYDGGTIVNSYARGEVRGKTTNTITSPPPIISGGFVGMISGSPVTITSSYFDKTATMQEDGIGKDTTNGQAGNVQGFAGAPVQNAFVDWDFVKVWNWMGNGAWPTLLWQTP